MVSLIFYFFISCYHFFLLFAVRQTYGKYLYNEIHCKFLTLHSQLFKILFTVQFGNSYMVSSIFYFFISCYHSLLFFAVRQTYGKYLYHEIHCKFLTLHSQVFKILFTVKFGNFCMVSSIFYLFISWYHSVLFFAVRQTYAKYLPNGTMKYIISF